VSSPAPAAPLEIFDAPPPAPRRSRAPVVVVALVVVAAIGAGGLLALRRDAPASAPAAPLAVPAATPAPAAPEAPPAPAPEAAPPATLAEAPAPASAAPAPAAPAAAVPPAAAPAPAPAPKATPPAAPRRSEDAEHRKLLAAAERKYEAGRFLEAIGDYRRALALRATGPAHVGLARALYDANRAGEALREVEAAIAEDGRYAPAWLLLGEIHQGEGRVRPARAAYERFLQLAPKGEQSDAVREIVAKQLQ
jgi:tetratricopeptide (TPR) repeat protein